MQSQCTWTCASSIPLNFSKYFHCSSRSPPSSIMATVSTALTENEGVSTNNGSTNRPLQVFVLLTPSPSSSLDLQILLDFEGLKNGVVAIDLGVYFVIYLSFILIGFVSFHDFVALFGVISVFCSVPDVNVNNLRFNFVVNLRILLEEFDATLNT